MGGEIGVRSSHGEGSDFWFTARLALGDAQQQTRTLSAELRGRNVLVVDDNEASATLLSELLVECGFVTECVYSGKAALELILQRFNAGKPFEFVLMDWKMPEMDGLETIKAIQELHIQPSTVLLMVAAHRSQELLVSAQMLGIQKVLSKPVTSSALIDAMMQVLGFEAGIALSTQGDLPQAAFCLLYTSRCV